MTSNITGGKKFFKKNNYYLFFVIGFFVVAVIFCVKGVYAYYHETTNAVILAKKIGDFDLGNGDMNMMIYKENDAGEFVRVYVVPQYFKFNDSLTSCTIPCNKNDGICSYSFDNATREFTLTSNQKVTCKFYFEQEIKSDINIYVHIENPAGSHVYNDKKYSLSNYIPAYGYEFTGNYRCEDSDCNPTDAVVTYNSETKKFSVSTNKKTNCYVYFDNFESSDIEVYTYVQDEYGQNVYSLVDSIPANKIYVLNEDRSVCNPLEATGTPGVITYNDGYIDVEALEKQVCNVYLDLESNS